MFSTCQQQIFIADNNAVIFQWLNVPDAANYHDFIRQPISLIKRLVNIIETCL